MANKTAENNRLHERAEISLYRVNTGETNRTKMVLFALWEICLNKYANREFKKVFKPDEKKFYRKKKKDQWPFCLFVENCSL